jgi:hypothetical protein
MRGIEMRDGKTLVSSIALALLIPSLADGTQTGSNPVVMREIVLAAPEEMNFSYAFPGPLKSAQVIFDYRPDSESMHSIRIKFGNGKQLELPSSVVGCFAHPNVENSFLLVQQTDAKYPTMDDTWWASVNVPYGEIIQPKADDPNPIVARHIYPYVGIQLLNWKLSSIVLQKSSHESRRVDFSKGCPRDDINWSLGK